MGPDVHLELHDVGDTFGDVTEAKPWPIGYVWERLRYDCSIEGSLGMGAAGFEPATSRV